MKKCFKCGVEKDISEFYKHKQMADGHLNKCKECAKNDVSWHRLQNIDRIRAYDRDRGSRAKDGYLSGYRTKYRNKYKATSMVNNAIRDGKMFREPCVVCGDVVTHAHHDDYLKPLNVKWLCAAHHAQWHRDNGEGKNG
jgi:hypothetical protein